MTLQVICLIGLRARLRLDSLVLLTYAPVVMGIDFHHVSGTTRVPDC